MILVIILCIVAIILLGNNSKRKKIEKEYKDEMQLTRADVIRYDQKTVSLLRIIWIVAFVIGFTCFLVVEMMEDSLSTGALVFVGLGFVVFVPITLFSFFVWLDGILYLKELEKKGYVIPENRMEYKVLQALPRTKEITSENAGKNKMFLGFSCFSIIMFFFWGVQIVKYVFKWYYTDFAFCLVLLCIGDLIWLLMVIRFFAYANNKKYRDEMSIELDLKKRPSLLTSIFLIVVYMLVSWGGVSIAHSMTRYVTVSRISAEISLCQDLETVAQSIYDENAGRTDEDWINICKALESGENLSITTTTNDEFVQELLERSGYGSTTKLHERFRLKNTLIWLQLENGEIKVKYNNPHMTDEGKPKG